MLWTEFGSNDIYRRFQVPNPIDVDKVTATLENGISKINAPETLKPKEIKAAAA
ncbi:MAG: Hsp20/alpha crystallin family protein [Acidobacteriia bacterium]|nr:Hsp20/alpha crystallin family protein [Terriglobia bacterium]